MKLIYWITILAIVGSIFGIIVGLFIPEMKKYVISGGTLLGVVAGTAIYSYQLKEKDSEK